MDSILPSKNHVPIAAPRDPCRGRLADDQAGDQADDRLGHARGLQAKARLLLAQVTVLGMLLFAAAVLVQASPVRVDELIQQARRADRDTERGGDLYGRHCARCHGPAALGDAGRFIPSLAGQRQAYLIKQLADFTELERDSPEMHNVLSGVGLDDPQAWADLAGWINALPSPGFQGSGDELDVALGEGIFREQCASCHELDAGGDDEGFVPSLRNQHHAYLLRQMRGLSSWHRLNVDEDLVRFLDSLDSKELAGLADYLSRLRGPTRDRSILRQDGTVEN